LGYNILYLAISGALLLIMIYSSNIDEEFSAVGQIYFDFGENSTDVKYLIYDNMAAGIRIKYPSNWNIIEQLGNISGNNILVDFYHTGINGTIGYSENSNVIVSGQDEYLVSSMKKYLGANNDSFAIQPSKLTPASPADISEFTGQLIGDTANSTIRNLTETLSNFTLLESVPTIISGLPGHEITYTIAGNQSEAKQTQAWTFKDNKWFVVTYSAEPSAYYDPNTARNIMRTIVLR
jgi:hypothetical protein